MSTGAAPESGAQNTPEMQRELEGLWQRLLVPDATGRITAEARRMINNTFGKSEVKTMLREVGALPSGMKRLNPLEMYSELRKQPRVEAYVIKRLCTEMANARAGFMPYIQEHDPKKKGSRTLQVAPTIPGASPVKPVKQMQQLVSDPGTPEADAVHWFYNQFVGDGNVLQYLAAFDRVDEIEVKNAETMLKVQEKYREIIGMVEGDDSYQSIADAVADLGTEMGDLNSKEAAHLSQTQINVHQQAIERLRREIQALEQKKERLEREQIEIRKEKNDLKRDERGAKRRLDSITDVTSVAYKHAKDDLDDIQQQIKDKDAEHAAIDGKYPSIDADIASRRGEIATHESAIAAGTTDEQLSTVRERKREIKAEKKELEKRKKQPLKLKLQQLDRHITSLRLSAGPPGLYTSPSSITGAALDALADDCDQLAIESAFPGFSEDLELGGTVQSVHEWLEDDALSTTRDRAVHRLRTVGTGMPPASIVLDDLMRIHFAPKLVSMPEEEKETFYTQMKETLLSSHSPQGQGAEGSQAAGQQGMVAGFLRRYDEFFGIKPKK